MIINKAKDNKIFRKNKVDGLALVAWDGVELTETTKDIKGLLEREYEVVEIITHKNIKYSKKAKKKDCEKTKIKTEIRKVSSDKLENKN